MKKIYKILAFGLFFFAPTVLVNASGIDWGKSIMMVEYTEESAFSPPFSCFGYTANRSDSPSLGTISDCGDPYGGAFSYCVWEYLDVLGYSDEENNPSIDNCFHQSGNYQTSITLVDYAENLTGPNTNIFTMKPGPPDVDVSTLTLSSNCSDGSLFANNQDICTATFKVKDKFGNPVTQLKGQTGKIYSNGDFSNDANSGDYNFRTGLRIDVPDSPDLGAKKIPTSSESLINFDIGNTDEVVSIFRISSWTPSMNKVGAFLGVTEAFHFPFHITTPTVDESGNLDLLNNQDFELGQYTPSLIFAPWAKIIPSTNVNPTTFILDAETPLKLARNIFGALLIGGPNTLVTIALKYHLPDSRLYLEGSDVVFNTTTQLASIASTIQNKTVHPILQASTTGFAVVGDIGFSTRIAYNISDGGIKTIKYPSGSVGTVPGSDGGDDNGSITSISAGILGASVEGKIIGKKEKGLLTDGKGIELNVDSVNDIREEIFLNSYKIERGIDRIVASNIGDSIIFNTNWFNGKNVAVVEDTDVVISSAGSTNPPTGNKTLLIKNGNLIIKDDFTYSDIYDSFGIILINDKVEKKPENGNIFVEDNVKNFIGTIFAEGSIFTIPNGTPANQTGQVTTASVSNGHISANNTQLIFTGTLLSHNTLGGALSILGDTTYFTPWGNTIGLTATDKTEAEKYDLHFMRSYKPLYDILGTQTNGSKCVCQSGNCSLDTPPDCEDNIHAMVIRYDGKVSATPPPGFKGSDLIQR